MTRSAEGLQRETAECPQPSLADGLHSYPLFDAMLGRRSRRFATGANLSGGPLAYESRLAPKPLTLDEEAALVFAAAGLTGHALAELPYQGNQAGDASNGNMMVNFLGRTIPSGDAIHSVTLFVLNDDGSWMVRRPQDLQREEIPALMACVKNRQLVDFYQKSRIAIADHRVEIPKDLPFNLPFNRYSSNVRGSTFFLPVADLTAITINVLLSVFSEEFGFFLLDERNGHRPAGIARFARSRGGHLDDDPRHGCVGTVAWLEMVAGDSVAFEQGAMLQNLALMTQALGLGGFPHFAFHPIWFEALGFRTHELPASRLLGLGPIKSALARVLGKDLLLPSPLGLERNGEILIKPYCPPYYPTMREAVQAFIDHKYHPDRGTFRDGGGTTAWKDGTRIQAGIPAYTDRNIEAVIAYCEYIHERYGRFPAGSGPLRTGLAHQAHHVDPQFYERFYRPEALSETQRGIFAPPHGASA